MGLFDSFFESFFALRRRFRGNSWQLRKHRVGVCFAQVVPLILQWRNLYEEKSNGENLAAQPRKEGRHGAHRIVHFGDLKWTPIRKGCDLAPVSGDFNAEGQPFVLRIRCADGTKIPAHWHPGDESVTVLKGTLPGMGGTFDETKLQAMNVGNFTVIPKEMRHFGRAKGDYIVQVHGGGPFKNNCVNPSEVEPPDAPAAAKPKP